MSWVVHPWFISTATRIPTSQTLIVFILINNEIRNLWWAWQMLKTSLLVWGSTLFSSKTILMSEMFPLTLTKHGWNPERNHWFKKTNELHPPWVVKIRGPIACSLWTKFIFQTEPQVHHIKLIRNLHRCVLHKSNQ